MLGLERTWSTGEPLVGDILEELVGGIKYHLMNGEEHPLKWPM